jgi:hypothetical protein
MDKVRIATELTRIAKELMAHDRQSGVNDILQFGVAGWEREMKKMLSEYSDTALGQLKLVSTYGKEKVVDSRGKTVYVMGEYDSIVDVKGKLDKLLRRRARSRHGSPRT